MDRLADRVVAAEAERDVRHAARDAGAGQLGLDPAGRLDEGDRVAGVLLDAGRDREDVRVEDDVLRGEARPARSAGRTPGGRSRPCARPCRPGPARRRPSRRRRRRSGGTVAACSRKASSPSLSEIELTTALPWTQRRPASMTDHFDESIITGTALMSGSVASRSRNRDIASAESSIASSMFTSMSWAPASTCWRATSTASSNRSSRISFANLREPVTFVRSPTFTKTLPGCGIASGSRPDKPRLRLDLGELARRQSRDRLGDRPDVGRRRPAAAAGDVHEPVAGEAAEDVGHRLRRVVVAAELVRQAGVRVDRHGQRRDAGEIRHVGPERGRAERAVEPDDRSAGRGRSTSRTPRRSGR